MSKTPINTRNWYAFENRQPTISDDPDDKTVGFYVIGEVETTNGAIVPALAEACPPGVNSKILILELSIQDTGGVGTTDISFREARFNKRVTLGQHTSVVIRYQGDVLARVDVQVVY